MSQPSLLENLGRSLLPSAEFVIHTHLHVEKVRHRITRITEPYIFHVDVPLRNDRPYHGDVTKHNFVVRRTKDSNWLFKHYQNTSLRIAGEFHEEGDETVVEMHLEMEELNKAAAIGWYGLVGLAFIFGLIVVLLNLPYSSWAILPTVFVPALIIICSAALTNIQFDIEASQSKAFFRDLLDDSQE